MKRLFVGVILFYLILYTMSMLQSCSYDDPEDSSSYCDEYGCVYCDYYNNYHDAECYGTGDYSAMTAVDIETMIQTQ